MDIQFRINDKSQGSFFIEKEGQQIAELDFEVKDNLLNAYHTGVRPELEGRGSQQDCLMKWSITHVKTGIR